MRPDRCQTFLIGCLVAFLATTATAGTSDNFIFDIEYLGDDMTALAPGSDEPIGTSVDPGDTFQWTIASNDDRYWFVETGGDFFPLMGITVNPAGRRTGDFSLVLRNNGADVFSLAENNVLTEQVHMGTNAVTLPTGLRFDEMFLDYVLNSAVDPVLPDPVDTIIQERLPIFGAPENNSFSPGIVYIPEPSVLALLCIACGLVALRRRRDF